MKELVTLKTNKQDQQFYLFLLLLNVRIKISLKFRPTWKSGMCSVLHCGLWQVISTCCVEYPPLPSSAFSSLPSCRYYWPLGLLVGLLWCVFEPVQIEKLCKILYCLLMRMNQMRWCSQEQISWQTWTPTGLEPENIYTYISQMWAGEGKVCWNKW